MKRKYIFALGLLPVVLGAFAIKDRVTFRREAWLQDYDQLKHEIEQSYANLKWSRTAKGVDLVALDKATIAALENAHNSAQARAAINSFLQGFKDGHLRLESGPPRIVAAAMNLWPNRGAPTVEFNMNAADACSAMGFKHNSFKVKTDLGNFVQDESSMFGAGVLSTADGKRYGFIWIPLFSQYDYGEACERAWTRYKSAQAGVCDENCQSEFDVVAKHEAAAALANEANKLSPSAHDGVIIDLRGNGGGTEWAEYVAAALVKDSLELPGLAGIRGPHWRAELGDSADVKCDLAGIWKDPKFEPNCWNVVRLPKDNMARPKFARPYTGKLFVLVDDKTASASEFVVGVLQDNRAATIVGTKTLGAGCGYTNGGVTIKLRNSGLVVKTPDCVRLRADGGNEYAGIKPDRPAL